MARLPNILAMDFLGKFAAVGIMHCESQPQRGTERSGGGGKFDHRNEDTRLFASVCGSFNNVRTSIG